jgi:hypothetical protein
VSGKNARMLALACFSCDVTVPLGAPILGSACVRAKYITHPLQVHGIVLLGAGRPIVIAGVDYTSIGNESYELWTREIARGAGTSPERVMLSTVHNHTAPLEDIGAEALLRAERAVAMPIIDVAFHAAAARRTGEAVAASLAGAQRITHVGAGEAVVDRVASNRRLLGPDGKVKAMRHSSTATCPELRAEPTGLIDPMLKTISFWNESKRIAAVHCYAVHPMSHYGDGEVTYDFAGLARERLRIETGVHQIYLTGCAGNTAPGKFNDGSEHSRAELKERMAAAMRGSLAATTREPLRRVSFRHTPLPLTPRRGGEFEDVAMQRRMADPGGACFDRVRAAFYLAYARRYAAGHRLTIPTLDLGAAVISLLPGEPFVEFQLAAQAVRPGSLVMTAGYGDYAPIYTCTDAAFDEGGYEPGEWAFVGRGSEGVIAEAIGRALA